MYRQAGATHIPLRVNSAGMIPLIFAFSILILPPTMASYFADPSSDSLVANLSQFFTTAMSPTSLFYWVMVFILVVVFTFFYALVTFNQQNLAENLQRNGGFVPGIRPGKPTHDYLMRVIFRITWGGALFLGFIGLPGLILGDGEISTSLQVTAHGFSKSAQTKIEAAGGSVVVIE